MSYTGKVGVYILPDGRVVSKESRNEYIERDQK